MDVFDIEELKPEHCKEVAEIEKSIFSLPWSLQSFKECVEGEDKHYFCAIENGEVIGYCGYWGVLDEAEICNVAVRADARKRGVGEALLNRLIEYGKSDKRTRFLLDVRVGNEAAISLYKKLGFKEDGIRPNFYDKPKEDALLMSLTI